MPYWGPVKCDSERECHAASLGRSEYRPVDRRNKLTNVTIIIHEGRGGRGPAGRMGRRHGRPEDSIEARGEHRHHHHGAGCGHRHEQGERPFGRHGMGHGRPEEQTEARGEHRHGHHHHGAGCGRHAPGNPSDEQRQLARRLRHQMRHIMQEAEAAGLSPERIERVVRRETHRTYL